MIEIPLNHFKIKGVDKIGKLCYNKLVDKSTSL